MEGEMTHVTDPTAGNPIDHAIAGWDQEWAELSSNPCDTGLLAIVFFGLLAICLLNRGCRKFIFRHLKTIACMVFLTGIVLYAIGFNELGSRNNLLVLLLRASVSSLEMFVSESDMLEVKHSLHDSPLYMTVFAITHFSAVFVSAIFILRLFGLKLLAMATLWLKRCFPQGNLYLFWDINPHTMTLAESIRKERNDLFVFVKSPEEHHAHSSRFTFSHFFQTSHSDIEPYVDRIEDLKGIILTSKQKMDMNLTDAGGWDAFYRKLGCKQLGKVIPRYKKVEFFFLSDDRQANIKAIGALKRQAVLNRNRPQDGRCPSHPQDLHIYVHVQRDHFTQGILSNPGLEYRIHPVDSSLLAALQLKENGRNHPIHFVDIDTATGTVASPFTALLIGFGPTGQDILRFLYEFSPFVKGTTEGADGMPLVQEQARRFIILDPQIESHKTEFLNSAPALRDKDFIEWMEGTVSGNQTFWNRLHTIINDLNYIVVAPDQAPDKAADIALQLFEFAHRYRKNLDKFRIYVRLEEEGSRQAFFQAKDAIQAFGTERAIFSHRNLATVSEENDAKNFFYQYSLIAQEIDTWATDEEKKQRTEQIRQQTAEALWRSRRERITHPHDPESETNIAYQEEQDRSNVCHIPTKLALAGGVTPDNRLNPARLNYLVKLTTRNERNEYPNAREGIDKQLLDNLSLTEHLRWNAKMELLGFVPGPAKDFRKKTHPCIVDCNELIRNEKTRSTFIYDTGVVELSFRKARQQASSTRYEQPL